MWHKLSTFVKQIKNTILESVLIYKIDSLSIRNCLALLMSFEIIFFQEISFYE